MFNPRRPYTHEEFSLEMRVDVEGLRIEIVLSQPEPPLQCDVSPRWFPAVDTGSEEPGTPRRLSTIGMGPDEPGVSRAPSTEREEFFPRQASVNGADGNDEATTGTSQQAAAREEFARHDKAAAAKNDSMDYQSKQINDPGGQQ